MTNTPQMTPVSGYRPQTQQALDLVNGFKADEERLLRKLDELQTMQTYETNPPIADYRWLAIGRTQLEQAFMAINRSIFKPTRVKLPEDVA